LPTAAASAGGGFFGDALPACAAYLLMGVIHDWADAEAGGPVRGQSPGPGPDAPGPKRDPRASGAPPAPR
jgi:hypothetical protein